MLFRYIVRREHDDHGQKFITLTGAARDRRFKNALSAIRRSDDRFIVYDRKHKRNVI